MVFDVDVSLAVTMKDGTTTVGYLADSITGEDHDELNTGAMELANGATDVAVSLGGLTTVEVLALKSDFQISLKINGSTTAILGKAFYLRNASITSLTASNASGSLAVARYVMAGT